MTIIVKTADSNYLHEYKDEEIDQQGDCKVYHELDGDLLRVYWKNSAGEVVRAIVHPLVNVISAEVQY